MMRYPREPHIFHRAGTSGRLNLADIELVRLTFAELIRTLLNPLTASVMERVAHRAYSTMVTSAAPRIAKVSTAIAASFSAVRSGPHRKARDATAPRDSPRRVASSRTRRVHELPREVG
jgi:hypothetical protein